jgi:nitrite reductase/ring-hydroxylating ferredoxin subunit
MEIKRNKRNIFQRILGIPATGRPTDPAAWRMEGGRLVVNLDHAPELARPGGALRIEGHGCPERVLVLHGEDGTFRAWRNRCGHKGRRLDPVAGTETIQCCSINEATYTFGCEKLKGPGDKPVVPFTVAIEGRLLQIAVG